MIGFIAVAAGHAVVAQERALNVGAREAYREGFADGLRLAFESMGVQVPEVSAKQASPGGGAA